MSSSEIGKEDGSDKLRKMNETYLAWNKKVPNTELEKFTSYIEKKHNLKFDSYWDLHKWTVDEKEIFWGDAWEYFQVISSKPYDKVFHQTGPGFLDNQWFEGAKMNYAENIMKLRDDTIAIKYFDTEGNFMSFTYAQMHEEVRLYAAAFKESGLLKGDTVACYMSNRPEAIFAMLAVVSIGAIWSGPSPFFGVKASALVMKCIEPKFIITVDRFYFFEETDLIARIPTVIKDLSCVEKVIIVPTKKDTLAKDISFIRNGCFLQDFLETGKTPEGQIPELIFEQLPTDHPIYLNFTSGTTGVPKGVVHSSKVLLPNLVNHGLNLNLKKGDAYMFPYAMGWTVWHFAVSLLANGVTLFLYNGYAYQTEEKFNFWNVIAEHDITSVLLIPSNLENFERENIVPSDKHDLKNFKIVTVGGSPVKIKHVEFLLNKVAKHIFAGNIYGSTELLGYITGLNYNLPSYAPEAQVPSLGIDLRCVDSNGKSLLGERGEIVIATPAPSFLTGYWQDVDNTHLIETHLTKHPGFWCQNDECWINPETKGIRVIGRCDDTLIQNGERFLPVDIYFAIEDMEELDDYVCVPQKKITGENRAVLFVKLKVGFTFTQEMKEKIQNTIKNELWCDMVPQVILAVSDIPYNINGKKVESLVKKIIATNKIPQIENIRNPECVKEFCDIPEILSYNEDI